MVILIPARAGSKRVANKTMKPLGGVPLLGWTIVQCLKLGGAPTVCSDSREILEFASARGALAWLRPGYTATDDAPDITWLSLALRHFVDDTEFMVRRLTSPFISAATMNRAMYDFYEAPDATAMRAMRPVTEHPCKMWLRHGLWMECPGDFTAGVESCSVPTQLLPRVYVQTAGLEIIRRSTLEAGSLTGDKLLPLFLDGPEALDINTPEDWDRAEEIAKTWTP